MSSVSINLDFRRLQDFFPRVESISNAVWYILVVVVLQTNGHEERIPSLWQYLRQQTSDQDTLLLVARRLRETVLKTSPLVGFPKGINCATVLRQAIFSNDPDLGSMLDSDSPLRHRPRTEDTAKRGEALFSKLYGKHAQTIKQSMRLASGGDLDQFALSAVYGELLSETSILDERETGLIQFTGCYASMAVAQAKGHMFGARNLGATKEDLLGAIELVKAMAPLAKPRPFDAAAFPFVDKVQQW